MQFSLIMSVYKNDNPSFFRIALDSVSTHQSLKPSQIVVVEDGPVSEEFDSIFNEISFNNPEIDFLLIKQDKNLGLATALNNAISHCKYEWIARMDSDDVSVPDRFEKQFIFIKNNPSISIVGGSISEFQNTIGDIKSIRISPQNHCDIKKMMKKRNPMNHMCICYRKEAIVKSGYYSEDFGKLEDYKLWVDMIGHGYIFANVPEVLCYVRIGNGFIARRANKREIFDWDNLQSYLLKNQLINRFEALRNKIYIRLFIYAPSWIKKLAYKTFLRRKK